MKALRRAAVVLVALAVALLVVLVQRPSDEPPLRGVARPGEIFGVTANTQDSDTGREQDLARALGVTELREELRWSEVEPREGEFDFAGYDRLFLLAAQRGLRILPVLLQAPKWVSPQPMRVPDADERWTTFVRTVIRRYGPDGSFWKAHPELDAELAATTWEVWNEPYLVAFDDVGPRPAQYARLVRVTAETTHAIDPSLRLLTAVETLYVARDGSTRDWIADLAAAEPGLGRYVDAVAVHPYSSGPPLSGPTPAGNRLSRIDTVQSTLERVGIGSRPLWLTELGWSTCNGDNCVSDDEQARYWSRALGFLREPRHRVAAVFPYRLRDLAPPGKGEQLAHFGLARTDGSRKPAFDVIRAAARQARERVR